MTLNGVMAIILPNSVAFVANYVKVWLINHQQIFSREMSWSTPTPRICLATGLFYMEICSCSC